MYRILVVDDVRDCADSLASVLSSMGNEVRTAYSSSGGLEVVGTFDPEVVFLDLTMPQMDGLQLGRLLRHRFPDITLVAITGRSGEGGRVLACGFDYYLVKPVDSEDLAAALTCADRLRVSC